MGKFPFYASYLVGLFCAAITLVSPVANAGAVSVDVSPTTGYSVTNRSTVALPPRTSTGPIQSYNPTLGPLAGGGAYQTTSSSITITALKEGGPATTTMSGRITATAGAMRNGLVRCLTSFRCNVALIGGAAGIDALLGGIGGLIEGGRLVVRPPSGASSMPPALDYIYGQNPSTALDSCPSDTTSVTSYKAGNDTIHRCCPKEFQSNDLVGYDGSAGIGTCQYGPGPPADPNWMYGPPHIPSPNEVDDLVSSGYQPSPSDLPYLSSGGLDFGHDGVDFDIVDIPSITGANAPSPTITTNPDGSSKGTYSEYKFNWSGPSKQPQVDVEETTTETTYSPTGAVTGTTTTTVTGGGSPANNPPEIPTDCDFMPTVCRFIDWFTEPDPEIKQDVDFTQLIDVVEIDRDFSVGASTAACPAPFVVNLSWVPSVEVSLQPFCDLADLLRPVLLAIASLFSGMIILRT